MTKNIYELLDLNVKKYFIILLIFLRKKIYIVIVSLILKHVRIKIYYFLLEYSIKRKKTDFIFLNL